MKILQSSTFTIMLCLAIGTTGKAQMMASLDNHYFSNSNALDNNEESPLAGDDHAMVVIDNSIIFEALENDKVNGDILDLSVDEEPLFGKVTVNEDYTFTYVPKEGTCEVVDSFSYIVSNAKGKDKATVYVDVICEEITIVSGFSPDGDGFNDAFTIIGTENFPNNKLFIFNEWGEELFEIQNYQNDWNGEGLEKDLYFYIFEDGKGQVYSGYVSIN